MNLRGVLAATLTATVAGALLVAAAPSSFADIACQYVDPNDFFAPGLHATSDEYNVVAGQPLAVGPFPPPLGDNTLGIRANDYVTNADFSDKMWDATFTDLKYYAISNPAHGTVELGPNGNFVYTSNLPADSSGTDSFTYRFRWEPNTTTFYCSNVATVTFNISPVAPKAVGDGPFTVAGNGQVVVGDPAAARPTPTGVLANDVNTISGGNNNLSAQLRSRGNLPASATLTWGGTAPGTEDNGSFTLDPGPNTPAGSYYFDYRACYEVRGGVGPYCSTDAIVAVKVLPTLAAEPDGYATDVDAPITANVVDNDFNNTGQAIAADTSTGALVKRQADHGGVFMAPDGEFLYAPDTGFKGRDSFTYSLCGYGSCSTALVSIRVGIPEVTVVESATAPSALRGGSFEWTFSEPVLRTGPYPTVVPKGSTSPLTGTYQCLLGGQPTACGTGFDGLAFTPAGALVAGAKFIMRVGSDSIGRVSGYNEFNQPIYTNIVPTDIEVRAQTAIGDGTYPITYTWASVRKAKALGRSYVQEQWQGATQTFGAKGSSIGLVMWTAPDGGTATVAITNKGQPNLTQVIDTYSRRAGDKTFTFDGLAAGKHRVTVTVNGVSGPQSVGAYVRIDGTVIGGVIKKNPKMTARWAGYPPVYSFTDGIGAATSLTFDGSAITWIALVGPNNGIARVLIDGQVAATKDLYSPSYAYDTTFAFENLGEGVHTISVVGTGTQNAAATDDIVTSQGFVVGSSPPPCEIIQAC